VTEKPEMPEAARSRVEGAARLHEVQEVAAAGRLEEDHPWMRKGDLQP